MKKAALEKTFGLVAGAVEFKRVRWQRAPPLQARSQAVTHDRSGRDPFAMPNGLPVPGSSPVLEIRATDRGTYVAWFRGAENDKVSEFTMEQLLAVIPTALALLRRLRESALDESEGSTISAEDEGRSNILKLPGVA